MQFLPHKSIDQINIINLNQLSMHIVILFCKHHFCLILAVTANVILP